MIGSRGNDNFGGTGKNGALESHEEEHGVVVEMLKTPLDEGYGLHVRIDRRVCYDM